MPASIVLPHEAPSGASLVFRSLSFSRLARFTLVGSLSRVNCLPGYLVAWPSHFIPVNSVHLPSRGRINEPAQPGLGGNYGYFSRGVAPASRDACASRRHQSPAAILPSPPRLPSFAFRPPPSIGFPNCGRKQCGILQWYFGKGNDLELFCRDLCLQCFRFFVCRVAFMGFKWRGFTKKICWILRSSTCRRLIHQGCWLSR